jgi:hypothetical protein
MRRSSKQHVTYCLVPKAVGGSVYSAQALQTGNRRYRRPHLSTQPLFLSSLYFISCTHFLEQTARQHDYTRNNESDHSQGVVHGRCGERTHTENQGGW